MSSWLRPEAVTGGLLGWLVRWAGTAIGTGVMTGIVRAVAWWFWRAGPAARRALMRLRGTVAVAPMQLTLSLGVWDQAADCRNELRSVQAELRTVSDTLRVLAVKHP